MNICDNCQRQWFSDELHDIDDYSQRVGAGTKLDPSGQCPVPDCGALCYDLDEWNKARVAENFTPIEADAGSDDAQFRCPKFYQKHHAREGDFEIEATVATTAFVNAEGDMYDDKGGDTEWDGDSTMSCRDCGYAGNLREFEIDPDPLPTPDQNWRNDAIQFPRLLAEIQAAGVLSESGWNILLREMDLESAELAELFDRAQKVWDEIKQRTVAA